MKLGPLFDARKLQEVSSTALWQSGGAEMKKRVTETMSSPLSVGLPIGQRPLELKVKPAESGIQGQPNGVGKSLINRTTLR